MITNPEKKIQSGFIGVLFLIALVILFFFHTKPERQKLENVRNEYFEIAGKIKSSTNQKEGLKEKRTLSEVEQKELTQAIPETLDQDRIIADLNRIAKSTDVSLNALTFTIQKSAGIGTISISTGLHGAIANIIKFLKIIEVNPRKLLVKDVAISRSETAAFMNSVNVNLTLYAFYRNE